MKFEFQMRDDGFFRFLLHDGQEVIVYSDWAQYRSLAILNYKGKTYIAASEYELLPRSNTVYEINEQDTTLNEFSLANEKSSGVAAMDPKATLQAIKTLINLIQAEDPIRLVSLNELEQKIDDITRWIKSSKLEYEVLLCRSAIE